MRGTILLSLLVLVLTSTAVSQTSDDKLVVPCVRAGKWTLKMTFDDLEKMNGPARLRHVEFLDRRGEALFYSGIRLTSQWARTKHARSDGSLSAKVGSCPGELTISLQSTRADIVRAYGKPAVETKPLQGQTNMIYDSIGVNFQIYE